MPRWVPIALLCVVVVNALSFGRRWLSEHQSAKSLPDSHAVVNVAWSKPEWRGVSVRMQNGIVPEIHVEGIVPSAQSLTSLQQAVTGASTRTRIRFNVSVQSGNSADPAAN